MREKPAPRCEIKVFFILRLFTALQRITGQWLMTLSEAITSLRSENEDLKAIKIPHDEEQSASTHVETLRYFKRFCIKVITAVAF